MNVWRMFFFIVAVFTLKSCVNHEISDPSVEPTTDLSLFEQGTENSFTYYQNGNILQAESPSPHGQFKLRFNTIATTVLDATGELPADGKFPNGSIVVKEAYQNNALTGLIIIKKASTDANASNGWLWGFYSLDGVATISIEEKGSQCVGCHSSSPNRDLIRTFDLH